MNTAPKILCRAASSYNVLHQLSPAHVFQKDARVHAHLFSLWRRSARVLKHQWVSMVEVPIRSLGTHLVFIPDPTRFQNFNTIISCKTVS